MEAGCAPCITTASGEKRIQSGIVPKRVNGGKRNPEKVRERNARRVWAGATYLATAPSLEVKERAQAHVDRRVMEFWAKNAEEREQFSEALDKAVHDKDADLEGSSKIEASGQLENALLNTLLDVH